MCIRDSQLVHNPKEYKIADGCGLSNYNYLSPALLVDFLKYAYSRTEVFRMLYKMCIRDRPSIVRSMPP